MDKELLLKLDDFIEGLMANIGAMESGKERDNAIQDLQALMAKRLEAQRLINDNTHKEIDEQLRYEEREDRREFEEYKAKLDCKWKTIGALATAGISVGAWFIKTWMDKQKLGMVMCWESHDSCSRSASKAMLRDIMEQSKMGVK